MSIIVRQDKTFRQLRESRQLTQRQVAEYAGITVATVSNIESAGRSPTLSAGQFAKLCELFNITIQELAATLEPH